MSSKPTSPAEAAARTAWIAVLMSQPGGVTKHELIEQARTTREALPEVERGLHEIWRDLVVGAVETTLRGWLPPVEADESPPSDERPAPRATIAELGYFEMVGRGLGVLPNAQRVRVLVASLVACAYEADLPPVELSIMVMRAARRYFARLKALASSAPYDGHGLIGYAFPPEKP